MRKPRDLQNYRTAAETANWLRGLAAKLESTKDEYPLVKVLVKLAFWNPEWEKPSDHSNIMTGISVEPAKRSSDGRAGAR